LSSPRQIFQPIHLSAYSPTLLACILDKRKTSLGNPRKKEKVCGVSYDDDQDDGREWMPMDEAFSAVRNWINVSCSPHIDIAFFAAVIQRPLVREPCKLTSKCGNVQFNEYTLLLIARWECFQEKSSVFTFHYSLSFVYTEDSYGFPTDRSTLLIPTKFPSYQINIRCFYLVYVKRFVFYAYRY
jgi:hypothetical protein